MDFERRFVNPWTAAATNHGSLRLSRYLRVQNERLHWLLVWSITIPLWGWLATKAEVSRGARRARLRTRAALRRVRSRG